MQKQALYPAEVADAVRACNLEDNPEYEVHRHEGEHIDEHLCVRMPQDSVEFSSFPLSDWEIAGMHTSGGTLSISLEPTGGSDE